MANITIDGKQLTVKDGITIIEAIDQASVGLPRYCYHPGLSIAGNCRICQVEVEKMPRTVIACNTRVAEGMVIHTQSEKAKDSQQSVLEFLLANHPLDCPVCDQAGECKLQDYYMEYGLYDPKFNDLKVKKTKKAFPIGPTIMLDQERCVLCTRCVRFGDEITKTNDFGVFNRGHHSELDVYPGKELNNKYSGNVADICPVGALTDRDFRFKMRVWYLGSQDSVCPGCARGCNIEVHYEKSRPYHLKEKRVMRLKPRENQDVNKWWMCDEGRYAYKAIDDNRIKKTRYPGGPTTSAETLNGQSEKVLEAALEKLAAALKGAKPSSWGVIATPQSTNEELFLVRRLFRDALKVKDLAFWAPGQEGYQDDFLIRADKNPNMAGAKRILALDEKSGDITSVVERAKKGEIENLFVFSTDLAKVFGADTLKAVRSKVKTLVFEGPNGNPTADAADFVLPSSSYAEKDGTFTNFEGRVQRIRKAVEPVIGSLPTWLILSRLLFLLGQKVDYLRADDVFDDLAKTEPAFAGMNYKTLGKGGTVWAK